MNSLNIQASSILGIEENRTEIRVGCVENLLTSELWIWSVVVWSDVIMGLTVLPPLSIAVQNTLSIDPDVLAAPLPEHNGVLQYVGLIF